MDATCKFCGKTGKSSTICDSVSRMAFFAVHDAGNPQGEWCYAHLLNMPDADPSIVQEVEVRRKNELDPEVPPEAPPEVPVVQRGT